MPDAVSRERSPVISEIRWSPKSDVLRYAPGKSFVNDKGETRWDGSDNWPLTWADDDHMYTAYGDGYGFEPLTPEKLGLGYARIIGSPEDMKGENIRSDGENQGYGRNGKKAGGILMVEGTLYLVVRNANNDGQQGQLASSTDYGEHWTWCDWTFEAFGYPTFINFGPNYQGSRDNYVYLVSPDGPDAYVPSDTFILARVPKDRITDRDAWEFLEGREGSQPSWTSDIEKRGAVFENKGQCLRSGITYNAGLKRYLWWQIRGMDKEGKDVRFGQAGFEVYDAPEPWGPWTTAFTTDEWDIPPGECGSFPTKWMSDDGRTVHLVCSSNDNFTIRQAELVLK